MAATCCSATAACVSLRDRSTALLGPPWRHVAKETLSVTGKSRFVIALLVLAFAGCGSTQLSSTNRHILAALQTAISAKNEQWLDGVAKQVDEQRTKGAMSDA